MRRSALALLLVLGACSSSPTPNQITVVSQNLYLGGDIFSIVQAGSAAEAAVATFGVWSSVQATNFPARAKVIAAGIAAVNPDVIGLQEVAIWRTGAPLVCAPDGSGLSVINDPQAVTVVYDFLASLQAELQALGLRYDVARVTQSFDAELCAVDPLGGQPPIDVRYTDRDVILVRSGLPTRNADGGLYQTMVEFPIPGTGEGHRPGPARLDHGRGAEGRAVVPDLRDAPRGPGDPDPVPHPRVHLPARTGRRAHRDPGEPAHRARPPCPPSSSAT